MLLSVERKRASYRRPTATFLPSRPQYKVRSGVKGIRPGVALRKTNGRASAITHRASENASEDPEHIYTYIICESRQRICIPFCTGSVH
jgi:hypothetical protein